MFDVYYKETPQDRYSQMLKDGLAEWRDDDDDHVEEEEEEWMIDRWSNEEGECVKDAETEANER